MPLLIALRPLSGEFGIVIEDDVFEASEETAESLESRGLAERYRPIQSISQFKMREPLENKMIEPSRNKKRA